MDGRLGVELGRQTIAAHDDTLGKLQVTRVDATVSTGAFDEATSSTYYVFDNRGLSAYHASANLGDDSNLEMDFKTPLDYVAGNFSDDTRGDGVPVDAV